MLDAVELSIKMPEWEGSKKVLHCDVALVKSGLNASGIDDGESGFVISARSIGPDHRIRDKVSWNGTLSKLLRYIVVSNFRHKFEK